MAYDILITDKVDLILQIRNHLKGKQHGFRNSGISTPVSSQGYTTDKGENDKASIEQGVESQGYKRQRGEAVIGGGQLLSILKKYFSIDALSVVA